MATLIKRSSSPYWYAQFYTPTDDGEFKQHRISTKLRYEGLNRKDRASNEKLAKSAADKLEEDFKRGIQGNAQGREVSQEVHNILKRASVDALKGNLSVDKGKGYLIELTKLCAGEKINEHDLASWRDAPVTFFRRVNEWQ